MRCRKNNKKNCSSSLWTFLHHMIIIMIMDILRSQNKITNFFMILTWVCPFNIEKDMMTYLYVPYVFKVLLVKPGKIRRIHIKHA